MRRRGESRRRLDRRPIRVSRTSIYGGRSRRYSRDRNLSYVGGANRRRRRVRGANNRRRRRSRVSFVAIGVVIAVIICLVVGVSTGFFTKTTVQSDDLIPVADSETTSTSITISFAGDCTLGTDIYFNQSTSFDAVYASVGDPSYFMANVVDIFSNDDYTVVNLEGVLTDLDTRADKTYAFKGPTEYTEILTAGSIEAVSLANNHSHDYGSESFVDTEEALDEAGVVHFGYDDIAYVDVEGVEVALIGTYMLAQGMDIQDEMVANIEAARQEGAQVVIVYMHWGVETETVPTTEQVQLGHIAIDAGADLVVGTHPHVIQGYEKYNGRYIVYSLGNFCFGGNSNPSDKDCMIFQQTFTVTGDDVATDDAINVIPCSVSSVSDRNNYQPTPAEGEEAERILEKIEESNASIAEISASLQ